MKKLFLLLLLFTLDCFAQPAPSIRQYTDGNLLVNPSFEQGKSGWILSSHTIIDTLKTDGKYSLSLASGAFAQSAYQDVDTSYLTDMTMTAWCNIWSNRTDLKLCVRRNGVLTTSCVDVESNPLFQTYDLYSFVAGTSTTGIELTSLGTGSASGMDQCFLGLRTPAMNQETGAVGPWIGYTPTFTGFGTPSVSEFFYRVNGSNIDIRGRFTSGTSTAVEARVSLPSGFTSAGTDSIPSLQIAGSAGSNLNDVMRVYHALIQPNVTYVNFSQVLSTQGSNLTVRNGNNLVGNGQVLAFTASVPIAGLNSRVSLYSQQCRKPSDCENVFSAQIGGTGTVTNENLDWINGNCTTGDNINYACTYNLTLANPMNCTVSDISAAGAAQASRVFSSTNTGITFGNGSASRGVSVKCQKQGADYKERNMITGTFRDVVTSPGSGSPALCSAKISSTGVISDQIGGCFASCTNATTPVCTFTSNYWVSGSVPNCWHIVNTAASGIAGTSTVTSTTYSGVAFTGSILAGAGNRQYFCHGQKQ